MQDPFPPLSFYSASGVFYDGLRILLIVRIQKFATYFGLSHHSLKVLPSEGFKTTGLHFLSYFGLILLFYLKLTLYEGMRLEHKLSSSSLNSFKFTCGN